MSHITIRTRATTCFEWSGRGARGSVSSDAETIRQAVVDAIGNFRQFVHGDGARDGIRAVLVTWEDGDRMSAFLFDLSTDAPVPAELPWMVMRTKPANPQRGGVYRD